MKKTLLFIAFCCMAVLSYAQDTIFFHTLTFDSTTRSGYFDFPDTNVSMRKIIMRYTIRCHDALVGNANGIGCYEWDYSCNTAIVDSSMTDSMYRQSPSHTITNFSGSSFPISFLPTWTWYAYDQHAVTYTSTISETTAPVGSGASQISLPLGSADVSRTQYLWTATEMSAAGLTPGNITSVRLDLGSLGSALNFLRIRIKPTSKTALDPATVDMTGFTEVYHLNTNFGATGLHSFNFSTPFTWNGTDNLIVEFSYKNAGAGTASTVAGANTGLDLGLNRSGSDYAMNFAGAGYVDVPAAAMSSISNEVTVAFWAYGAANQPVDNTVFEGADAANRRQINVHLPWSNGRVYWDCGNDGTGYDRIDFASTATDYKGRWTHWAFTKNAVTGDMKIYRDGVMVHSGTGKTKPIDITNFHIGGATTWTNGYYGKVDEFQVFSQELNAATIQAWMYRSLTPAHPAYGALVAYYPFNEGTGLNTTDASPNAATATVVNGPVWYALQPLETYHNFSITQERPRMTFVQGVYTSNTVTTTVLDSLANPQHSVTEYSVTGTDLVTVGTTQYYQAGWQYVYDTAGVAIDSVLAGTDSTLSIVMLDHYVKAPMALELLSLVTPYGNGLDLGQNGAMWEFDVTDFYPVLKGRKYLYMYYGGEYQEEIKISFLYITGTPPRDVISIQQVWPLAGRLGWSNDYNSILNNVSFEPRQITLNPASAGWKLRAAITGHGQEGEFILRQHWLDIDGGAREFAWNVWKECSEVPIYPQGGTWLYDRAGWCPGDPTDLKQFEITSLASPGQTITVDYGLNAASGIGDSRYLPAHQLVTYGAPNFTLDAAVDQVKRPNNWTIRHGRFNPACNQPVIIIRNEGSTTLTSLDITYSVRGGTPVTFQWTGNLAFLQSQEVTVPVTNPAFWTGGTADIFDVTISNPNGGTDQNPDNNVYASPFSPWPSWTGNLSFYWRTNNKPYENSWKIYDETGAVVLQSSPFLTANTIYNEQLNLAPGCYTLRMDDTGDDGLYYWALSSQGAGYFQLRENGVTVKTFQREFGGFFQYDFHTDGSVAAADGISRRMTLFPNPSSGEINLELAGYGQQDLRVEIYSMNGQRILSETFGVDNPERFLRSFDLSGQPAGTYLVTLYDGAEMITRKVELIY